MLGPVCGCAVSTMSKYEDFSPDIPNEQDVLYGDLNAPDSVQPEEPKTRKATARRTYRPKDKKVKPLKRATPKEGAAGVPFSVRVKELATCANLKLALGMCAGALGIWMLLAFISYLTSCFSDQALVNNSPVGSLPPVSNKAGEGGARLSELLINEGFGLGSLVIVVWLIGMALKLLVGWPKFKSVNFTIKCLVALVTLSLIVGLTTIAASSSVNWGGYHGRYVNEFIIGFIGWPGAALLCVLFLALFVGICLRDVVKWLLRLKRDRAERIRIRKAEIAEQERRELELEEMRLREENDAAASGEGHSVGRNPQNSTACVVDFQLPENSDSYALPDLDEYYGRDGFKENTTLDETSADISDGNPEAYGDVEKDKEGSIETVGSINEGDSGSRAPLESDDDVIAIVASGEAESVQSSDKAMVVNVNNVAEARKLGISSNSGVSHSLYKFPDLDLLRAGVDKISVDAEEQLENKEKIRKTLLDFNIPITNIEATVGPTITLYEIRPERGVKISKIRTLADDIALQLSAIGVRIIAPIPGKGTVGIEVANKDPQTVSMRTVINSAKYQQTKAKLPVAIGSTISNEVYIADLAKMPHLLVAGATGQGKSVGLNAIIASLLYCKKPHELKFVMIDPKQVEFSLYAKIEKHYLAKLPDAEDPIITDMNRVVETLNSLCEEMDNRYLKLKQAQVRNLEEYNSKVLRGDCDPGEDHRFLPYIVLVVDEFADLIMTSGKEVETPIARLAQKARAVGMHVIIATQRPSTNVITGIIKANFPVRIAFKVTSGVDSKTILDTPGAQLLIGRGDMLISNNSEMVRVQCAFIDTPEVEAICSHISSQPGFDGPYMLPEPTQSGGASTGGDGDFGGALDPLLEECARLVVSSNTASTSGLQRRFSIGYNRAGKIMDQLEAAGIVGPSIVGKQRDVLVDNAGLEMILEQLLKK